MVNKLKIYAILTLLVFGLVFLGIGCTGNENGESSSQGEETSSGEVPGAESRSITLKGSDTVLPIAQAEAEEFMLENPD